MVATTLYNPQHCTRAQEAVNTYSIRGTIPGPQSIAFSCFPDSKSHILIWLSSELEAATVCITLVKDLTVSDGYKLAGITVTRARLYDLHDCYFIWKLLISITH